MTTSQPKEPIAVIGMACRFPGGSNSPSKLWDLLKAPRDISKRVPTNRFDSTGFFHPNGSHHGSTDCQDAYFIEEDVTKFDNGFFNIQPGEAEALDPQQRLLLETVYESLCAAGQTIDNLKGSNTASFVGLMCDDWSQMASRDWDLVPTYSATGTSRAVLSNRISYFFDWHGPSMTVDTACSSSLVAVHQGVNAIRSGECSIAVAAGANLVLSPGMWIAESKLHMLSPTGTSKMWDAAADGYARGEGVAAVILKPLSAALRDGDNIDCVIRETGVNQDGRTAGLTMPSNLAQTDLIRDTYERAGLDINDPKDRPQFFHAHGTGTPAGDPQEAQAISRAFFESETIQDPLFVGSIKTVIGHTEGTAGLASLIGTALAMKHGTIAPNLHFNTVSEKVAPFYKYLQVPTKAMPWPNAMSGQPRRASINSFGFGGTNAHAIIEGYENAHRDSDNSASFTPLIASAASPSALRTMLSDLKGYLLNSPGTSIRDVAHTLQNRRSTFTFRKAITGNTVSEAIRKIDNILTDTANDSDFSVRFSDVSRPSILGVFTGQGAQWPRMGALLIESSPLAAKRFYELEAALSSLPEGDRPSWKLTDQILADASTSRLSEAAIAQPLCTAVQIVLVDLIRAAEINLRGVVGHSSGEIGAAYAAGFLSANDAMRVAYFRGVYAKLARSPDDENIKGAMMAAGTSYEDALEFCEMDDFEGRIQVAARNSSTSVTLSGDEDAINEAEIIFKDEGKFARKLKVDTAYHSHHMRACSGPYRDALDRCNITAQAGNDTLWFSSVVDGQVMTADLMKSQYWVDNMTGAVLFAPAVENAFADAGPFDLGIEFGPHPALKGPCLDTIEELAGHKIPYTGLLARQKVDTDELSSALGFIWAQLGAGSVNFDGFEKAISGSKAARHFVSDLPQYPFDRSRSFYNLTRFSGSHLNAHSPMHPLLGRRCVETESEDEISWRNILRSTENSWLQGHALQGQAVFPAMGYLAMAVEAAAAVAGSNRQLGLISLNNVSIGRAMAFSDEAVGMEARISMKITQFTDEVLSGRVTCHSGLPFDNATPLALNFSTNISISFHEAAANSLPVARADEVNLANAEPTRLYSQFNKLGYNYSAPFTGVKHIQRKKGFATGEIEDLSGDAWEDQLIVHPALLDSALQTAFAAYCHPHDERFWTLHVPTGIRSVVINPYFTDRGAGRHRNFQYQSACKDELESPVAADIDVFAGDGSSNAFVQFESVQVQPFAASGPSDDACVFTHFEYKLAEPDARMAVVDDNINVAEAEAIFQNIERVGFYILRRVYESVTPAELESSLPHFSRLLDFASRTVPRVARGDHPTVPKEAIHDSPPYIRSLIAKHHDRADMQLLGVINEHLVREMRRNGSMIEHMLEGGLLDRFYEEGFDTANVWIARIIKQISHRYPQMRLFEIGAGTGGSTRFILPQIGDAFTSYTFTDLSAGFFERANDRFISYSDRMVYSTYNMENPPTEQGFEEGAYDVVLASNAVHATGKIEETIANARSLLRPGGYMVLLEIMGNDFLGIGASMGGLPGWWAGAEADPTRCDGPCFTVSQWDALVKRHGFSGVETHTPLDRKMQWYAVLVCRAVDDRVISLQKPLSTNASTPQSNNLVIVGGRTSTVAKLVAETSSMLQSRYETITHVKTLEDLITSPQAPGSSVLSLTELDEQFLEIRTEKKLEALKTLWRNSRTVMLVTRGARNESPHSSSMVGLSRVVRFEYPHLNIQVVDFDKTPESEILAESLLRLEISKKWEQEGVNMLGSVEPELHYVDGKLFIPRLYRHQNANDRFNTYRRTVSSEVDPRETPVLLEPTADGKSVKPCSISPLRQPRPADERSWRETTIQVQQSLLQAIKVGDSGFLNLFAGMTSDSGEYVVAFTDASVESTIRVPSEWTTKATETSSTLGNIAANIVAKSIISTSPSFGTIVAHEANGLLRDALDKEAAKEGIQIVFTTSNKESNQDDETTFIHEMLPARLVQKLLPQDVSLFLNLSPRGAAFIERCLPRNTRVASLSDFIRTRPHSVSAADITEAGQYLKTAWAALTKQRLGNKSSELAQVIPLNEVRGTNLEDGRFRIADWRTECVEISLRPIDSGTIFRSDGTYFLLGLSGELGQSLCSWMVAHGARNVVLSSRSPKVDPRYLDELAAQGANIKVLAADITRRESLRACYDTIRRDMPPVIGVANGAMVLEDVMFDDLEFASQERAMPPKVEGSLYLDEIFYDTPLDFFILFTSLAHIGGNTGQSTYVMANLFMNALAAQRRDVRGVPGSDMAIGSVTGMGFFERSSLDKDHFSRLGYRNMSEQDLHQQFAEAILAGRPGSNDVSEVVVGIQPYYNTPNIQAQLRTDPRFKHFLLQDRDTIGAGQGGGNSKLAKPRTRLATVQTRAEAIAVVQETFVDRLKRILLMSSTDTIDPMSSLVELGADSIMAVDVRSWFLKELDVDIPVLKILGPGETVAVLVQEAVDKLPTEIIDLSKLEEGGDEPLAPAVSTEKLVLQRNPELNTTIMESSSSTDTASSPVSATPPDTFEGTPLETPLGTEADVFDQKGQLQMKLQKHQESTGQSWREKTIGSSTEHTEQMTYGQNRFWFLSHYVDDPTTFNIAYLAELTGHIRVDDLSRAVDSVIQRHETFRTRFFWSADDTKTPMQGIISKPLVRLETASISSSAEATEELKAMHKHQWDLGDWVPIRLRLLSLSDTAHFLIVGSHHISMDGHSFSVLMLDIQQAYNSPGNRIAPLANDSQARAFGAQQRVAYETGKLKAAINYHRNMIPAADLKTPIELFSFARTQVRPALDRYDTHVVKIHVPVEVTTKLKQLARGHRATAFHAYLAALQALLFRLLPASTTDKVIIGLADANRLDSKFMGSVGNFLNVLPIRFDRADKQSFGKAMETARDRAYGGLTHSALPFDLLLDELEVPRSNCWAPIFQVFMDYRLVVKDQANKNWIGCKIGEENWHTSKSGYDVAVEIMEGNEGAMVAMHVQKALYDAGAAQLLVDSYVNVLKHIAAKGDKISVQSLPKWDSDAIKQGLSLGKGKLYCSKDGALLLTAVAFIGSKIVSKWPATTPHRIDQVISEAPNSPALKDGYGHILSYKEMDSRVDSIAHTLRQQLPPQEAQPIVGVFQMPSADWMCSLLAIQRIGAVYLPLDLRNGVARLKSNVDAAKPTAILTDAETASQVKELCNETTLVSIDVSKLPQASMATRIETSAAPGDAAYIIFTSGSTGQPKGIVVKHSGLMTNLEGYHTEWSVGTMSDVVLQQTALSFDASLVQIFAALTTGGCLFVVPADARGDPAEVTRLMVENKVTMTQATPSEYDMWFRFAPDTLHRCTTWRAAWFGGERAGASVLDGFRNACKAIPALQVYTSYGPTESTISAMKGEADIRNPDLRVPVPGRPLPNYAAYILDDALQPVPNGVPGEIVLGGAGVGKNGYLNEKEMTAKSFIKDPFTTDTDCGWGRMYRTGDYGRLNAKGYLTVEGRIAGDTQVKLRGFRIELAEIESVIVKESSSVTDAVVTLRGGGEEAAFLVAHVIMSGDVKNDQQMSDALGRLRSRLSLCLPQYMCPSLIVPLEKLPLTPHQKVDRKALQALDLPKVEACTTDGMQNLTSTENRLGDLWKELLPSLNSASGFGPQADFFRSGGNSLLLVKLQAAIRREFNEAPRLSKLMSAPELGAMAALLDTGVGTVNWQKETELEAQDKIKWHARNSVSADGLVILLTGATGSLGRKIVQRLASNDRVARVVCLVRPADGRNMATFFPGAGGKVHILAANLPTMPTDNSILDVDVVLHCAADRNFWDGYEAVKPVNVDTAKALARLCLRTGARLHVLSSGLLSEYESKEGELSTYPNSGDGYMASKWVAEKYLAHVARETGLQITTHRPTATSDDAIEVDQMTKTEAAMADSMLSFSKELGVRPDFANFGGIIDLTPVDGVAEAVAQSTIAESAHTGMRIITHCGTERMRTDALAVFAEELFAQPRNSDVSVLPSVSVLHWVGLSKRAGLFEWFFTAQHVSATDERGNKIVSRR